MLLLEKVFDVINKSGLDYCIQNKYEMMPEEIPSDIDMMYKDASEQFLDNLVKKIAKETGLIITQKICQGYFEYTYIISYPCPSKYFQLQLDFYRAISKRGYLNIMPAEDLLKNKRFYKCFYVPGYYDEIKYMWIRRTIKKDLNEEHLEIVKNIFNNNADEYTRQLQNDFGSKNTENILEMLTSGNINIFYDNYDAFAQKAKEISQKNSSFAIRLKYLKFFLFKLIPKRLFHKCGMSVAFLSADAQLKADVIEKVGQTVGGSFYGNRILKMRPMCIKKEQSKNAKSKSFGRFLLENFDYLFGTLKKVNRKKIGKQLVIFDGYYYDYFVDMQRYNYRLPAFIPHIFRFMIPKPDMIFVLNTSAESIYNKNQSIPMDELQMQTEKYMALANKHKRFCAIDAQKPVQDVVNDITKAILNLASKRAMSIMK